MTSTPAASSSATTGALPCSAGWAADKADFFVDTELVRSCPRPPSYPMQMMLAVFDFPDESTGDDHHAVPALIVDHLRGYQP